jgi:glycyl-tRNA synthetase
LDRICLALLCNGYREDMADTQKEGQDQAERISLSLPACIAPVQVAVLPLSKKLSDTAESIYADLRKAFRAEYDVTGSIGKRYRRQDEIGTPFCVTVDFDTLEDQAVTIRDRDAMTQERVSLDQLKGYLAGKIL